MISVASGTLAAKKTATVNKRLIRKFIISNHQLLLLLVTASTEGGKPRKKCTL